jgi:hypothetical protein
MIRRYFSILLGVACLLLLNIAAAQSVSHMDSLSGKLQMEKVMKFKSGDNLSWASPGISDSSWDRISSIDTTLESGKFTGSCWFRIYVKVSPALFGKPVLLITSQSGASEIYLNGKLVESFGKVGDKNREVFYDPHNTIHYLYIGGDTLQMIAVRFSANKLIGKRFVEPSFNMQLADLSEVNDFSKNNLFKVICATISAIFLTLSLFHFLLFIYYRKVRSNLYYSILAFLLSLICVYPAIILTLRNPLLRNYVTEINMLLYAPCFLLIIELIYSIFKEKRNKFLWVLVLLTLATEVSVFIDMDWFAWLIPSLIMSSSF